MSDKPNLPPDDDADDLVAYLDGELDPRTAEEVETRISLDPKARAEADALKRTWDLLDHLPRPEPSPTFTSRTLDRVLPVRSSSATMTVAPGRASTARMPAVPPRRRWVWAGWAAATVIAGALGWYLQEPVHRSLFPGERVQDAQLLAEQRMLENLRLYRHVDDLEFLTDLDSPDLFGDDGVGQ